MYSELHYREQSEKKKSPFIKRPKKLIAIISFIFVAAIFSFQFPWAYETCRISRQGREATPSNFQASQFVHSTCGELHFPKYGSGSGEANDVKVGKSYEIGVNGLSLFFPHPLVVDAKPEGE